MSKVIMLGGDVERTPEDQYRGAAMWARESAAARDDTQRQIETLDTSAIYRLYEGDQLMVRQVDIIKATPKQYKVHHFGADYTISRPLLDSGNIATSGREKFASGATIRPMLQEQLDRQNATAERCARKLEEKRQALESNQP